MEIRNLSTHEWEARLGAQIRELRLRQNLTQAEVARQANIDRTTVGRIESGDGGSVGSLVRIARALGRDGWLESFAPPVSTISPMEQLRERQRSESPQRQRARPSTKAS